MVAKLRPRYVGPLQMKALHGGKFCNTWQRVKCLTWLILLRHWVQVEKKQFNYNSSICLSSSFPPPRPPVHKHSVFCGLVLWRTSWSVFQGKKVMWKYSFDATVIGCKCSLGSWEGVWEEHVKDYLKECWQYKGEYSFLCKLPTPFSSSSILVGNMQY